MKTYFLTNRLNAASIKQRPVKDTRFEDKGANEGEKMGACYSCTNCGKCTKWLSMLQKTCLACKKPVAHEATHCPHCGSRLPLPPGISSSNEGNYSSADANK